MNITPSFETSRSFAVNNKSKPFELAVLISVINDAEMKNVQPQDKHELISHVVGKEIDHHNYHHYVDDAIDYLRGAYSRVREAADLVAHTVLDDHRYIKLMDLYRKTHHIEPMIAN